MGGDRTRFIRTNIPEKSFIDYSVDLKESVFNKKDDIKP